VDAAASVPSPFQYAKSSHAVIRLEEFMRFGLFVSVSALVLAGALGNVACAPNLAPVYSPSSPAGLSISGTPYTAEQVENAVVQGATSRGWVIVQRTPGTVIADINSGGHGARVRVLVTEGGWRIVHESSSPSLKYGQDARHGEVIHRRYNHWVRLLDESVRQALVMQSSGGYAPAPGAPPPAAPPPEAVPAPG
jgi:hypothetical protein